MASACCCRCPLNSVLVLCIERGCCRYLSLGYYEKADVATVVEYLKASGAVTNIALWGHSMGAATSLLYASGGGETLIRRHGHTSSPPPFNRLPAK